MNTEGTESAEQSPTVVPATAQHRPIPAKVNRILLVITIICAAGFSGLNVVLVVAFIVQPVRVEGMAMLPTLNSGDRVLVGKSFERLERGDIVVFWYPEDPSKSFIKRIIGLPGEVIQMNKDGQLYINNMPVDEPYISPERNRSPRVIPEQYIKPHYYFVMGDNRDASNDSRSWGLVPEKYVYGKLLFRYWHSE